MEDAYHPHLACLVTLKSLIESRGVLPAAFNAPSLTAVDVHVGAHEFGRKIGLSCRMGVPAAGTGRPWCDSIGMCDIQVTSDEVFCCRKFECGA